MLSQAKSPMAFFQRWEKKILKFLWSHKKILDTQGNPKAKEQCWEDFHTRFQAMLWSHSNKNSIVPSQKHKQETR